MRVRVVTAAIWSECLPTTLAQSSMFSIPRSKTGSTENLAAQGEEVIEDLCYVATHPVQFRAEFNCGCEVFERQQGLGGGE